MDRGVFKDNLSTCRMIEPCKSRSSDCVNRICCEPTAPQCCVHCSRKNNVGCTLLSGLRSAFSLKTLDRSHGCWQDYLAVAF